MLCLQHLQSLVLLLDDFVFEFNISLKNSNCNCLFVDDFSLLCVLFYFLFDFLNVLLKVELCLLVVLLQLVYVVLLAFKFVLDLEILH
jgi:hypothetical protein